MQRHVQGMRTPVSPTAVPRKGKGWDEKAGNEWADQAVNMMALLLRDLEGFQPRCCVRERLKSRQLPALTPAISPPPAEPQLGSRVLRAPGALTHPEPCASRAPGQVASLWQGHKAGWRAGVPSNEVPPPGLCRMKIIPYSYTLHANINCLSHLFHT